MVPVTIELVPADAKQKVASLLAVYLSELGDNEPYEYFPQYWSEPNNRYPFFLRHNASVAGFAFVRRTDTLEMAEFYVLPEFRHMGVGRAAVAELLCNFAGTWRVAAFPGNERALAFWRSALNTENVQSLSESSEQDRVEFSFESMGRTDV